MALTTKCENFSTTINSSTGGAVRVTLSGGVGQGNGGTSLPCRECWVHVGADGTGPVTVNIGSAASTILGVEIKKDLAPFKIPVDDVSKLYFFSATAADVIDILWRS